jgi:hypothetical protein
MKYGYDISTGHLFSFDKDFSYDGIKMMPPVDGQVFLTNRCVDSGLKDILYGCLFASGWKDAVVLYANGDSLKYYLVGMDMFGFWHDSTPLDVAKLKKSLSKLPLCVCGDSVYNPSKMLDICCLHSNSRIFVCPVVEELASFGVLVKNIGIMPYRMKFAWDNNKEISDCDFKTFDKKLDGDSYGRMADLVAHGVITLNEIMNPIGVSPFFDRVIHRDYFDGCVFIVRMVDVDRLFPDIPISAKNYAATSVPVKMKTSCEFRKETGYNGEFADIFVSTDYVPEISIFMRFYKTMSGRGIVCTSKKDSILNVSQYLPVFRSQRAYKVPLGKYEQINRAI